MRLVGKVRRAMSCYYVSYDPDADAYVVHIKPGLNAYWTPKTWAKALADGSATLIGRVAS